MHSHAHPGYLIALLVVVLAAACNPDSILSTNSVSKRWARRRSIPVRQP